MTLDELPRRPVSAGAPAAPYHHQPAAPQRPPAGGIRRDPRRCHRRQYLQPVGQAPAVAARGAIPAGGVIPQRLDHQPVLMRRPFCSSAATATSPTHAGKIHAPNRQPPVGDRPVLAGGRQPVAPLLAPGRPVRFRCGRWVGVPPRGATFAHVEVDHGPTRNPSVRTRQATGSTRKVNISGRPGARGPVRRRRPRGWWYRSGA